MLVWLSGVALAVGWSRLEHGPWLQAGGDIVDVWYLLFFIYYMNRTPSTKKQEKRDRQTDRQTTECNQHVDK